MKLRKGRREGGEKKNRDEEKKGRLRWINKYTNKYLVLILPYWLVTGEMYVHFFVS